MKTESIIEYAVIPLMTGFLFNAVLIYLAMHFRINNSVTYSLFLSAELLVCFFLNKKKRIGFDLKQIFPEKVSPGMMVILTFSCFLFIYALVPFYLWDDVIRHLHVPDQTRLFGLYSFDPAYAPALDSSIIPQSSYVMTYMLGGEFSVRILNYILMVSGLFTVEKFCREILSEKTAAYAAVIISTVPILLWMTGIAFIDSFNLVSSLSLLLLTYFICKDKLPKGLVPLFFIGITFTYLSKQQGLFVIMPCCVFFVFVFVKSVMAQKKTELIIPTISWAFFPLAVIGSVLIHNYIISGNPMFPYYNGVFKSPYFDPSNFLDTRWNSPLNLETLEKMTFYGSRYVENWDYSLGFAFFTFLLPIPVLFYKSSRKQFFLFVLFLAACSVFIWKNTTGLYMRYGISIFPVLAVFAASVIDKIISIRKDPIIKTTISAVFGIVCILNFIAMMNLINFHGSYPLYEAVTGDLSKSMMRESADVRKVYEYAAEKYGKNSKGFILNDMYYYFAKTRIGSNYWYFNKDAKAFSELKSDPEKLFRYIFSNYDFAIVNVKGDKEISEQMLLKNFEVEYSRSGVFLIKPHYKSVDILKDSFDPPLSVTEWNPRVIRFEKSQRKYRIRLECSGDEADTMARFQINWLDAKGLFIGTSLKPFSVSTNRKEYVSDEITDFPTKAVFGELYLSGHTQKKVLVYSYELLSEQVVISDQKESLK
jgi:4-amino-4-deoxy-L-arabinose transferase-like glycosyltransferase